eukprot:8284938-Prorocentrum_lima.AAC.1
MSPPGGKKANAAGVASPNGESDDQNKCSVDDAVTNAASLSVEENTSVKDKRVIIEYFCSNDSIIAKMAPHDCK